MKKGKSLTELAQELQRIHETKKDFQVPTSKLIALDDGKLAFQNGELQSFGLTNHATTQLAAYSDIPKQYMDRIRSENPKLFADSVNHGLQKAVKENPRDQRLLRTLDGNIRGFLSSRYRILDAYDLLTVALPTLLGNQFEVASSEITEKKVYLKCLTPRLTSEVKKGDYVNAGLLLSTSDVGAGYFLIQSFINRLACENGAIMPTQIRKAHIGRNDISDDIREVMSDSTKQLSDAAFFASVKDYLTHAMSPENFEREVNKMRESTERKIENFDLQKVVELSMNHVGLKSDTMKNGILAALASGNEGAGLTQWGLANSFTRYAQDENLDYETATALEAAGGEIINLNASQWKRIATA